MYVCTRVSYPRIRKGPFLYAHNTSDTYDPPLLQRERFGLSRSCCLPRFVWSLNVDRSLGSLSLQSSPFRTDRNQKVLISHHHHHHHLPHHHYTGCCGCGWFDSPPTISNYGQQKGLCGRPISQCQRCDMDLDDLFGVVPGGEVMVSTSVYQVVVG